MTAYLLLSAVLASIVAWSYSLEEHREEDDPSPVLAGLVVFFLWPVVLLMLIYDAVTEDGPWRG